VLKSDSKLTYTAFLGFAERKRINIGEAKEWNAASDFFTTEGPSGPLLEW
jgi:hypothetical protein